KKDVPEEIDNEIIEIFLEEAEEEFGNISVRLPAWQSDPSDEAILKELRRSFHTLKGSGRLVGASEVGEFAWAFENMLNRVIDHTIEADQTIFNLLEQARLTLPSLFDMFKTGEGASQEIFNLMEQADAISQGAPINASIEIAAPPVDKGDTPFKESAPTIPDIDEVLRDIYRKEAANHLNALREYVDDWRADTDKSANQKLIRALHTLTGSSRTAGLPGLASICSRLEKVADVFAAESNDVTDELLELVEQSMSFVQQTVDMLDNPGIPIPEHDDLLQGIQDMEVSLGGSLVNIEPTDSGLQRLQVETSNEPSSQFDLSQSSSQSLQADDSYDDELLEIFLEEGSEILEDSDQVLHRWGDDLANADHLEALQRQLHTLKGGARMAGVTAIGDLSHSIESMLTAIAEGQLEPSEEIHDVMLRTQDRLVHLLDQLKNRQKLTPAKDLIAVVAGIIGHEVSFDDEEEEEAIHAQHIPDDSFMDVEDIQLEPVAESSEPIVAEENVPTLTSDNVVPLTSLKPIKSQQLTSPQQTMPEKKEKRELVRVRSDLLDNLVNFAGEVSIYRSRMEQQTNAFRYNLTELDETVSRLRDQLRKFEMEAEAQIQYRAEESLSATQEDFDPLEFDRFTQMQQLSRGMLESLNDLDSLRGILGNLTRESETLLVQQSRVNTELQEGLMRTRMVPFSSQTSRLRRIVRQTAEELGKFAELHLHGADSEMDRTVLERMLPALEHMLRNAVAHGLEDSETRRNTGKEETGQIDLSISREGADIVIKLTDDGQGIDLDAIQSKAIAKGMIKPGANVTKETLLEMIMESGFSTADEVTQISGRGVGMDVVNSEIKQLGGILNINTEQGVGTMFTVSLPLTLSVTRALMVNVSEDTYAIPLLSVEGVERVDTTQLEEIYAAENPVYHWVGQDYPFIHLGETMGISKRYIPRDRGKIPLLIVRSGEFRAAIQVDNLIGSREVVVKPVGAQLSTMQGISGATIMGDGSVVLIIDLGVLVRRVAQTAELYPAEPVEAVIEQPVAEKPLVMVVDDSITVRKVTTRLLERNDYRSTSAKDGVDALSQLQEVHPDVILLDVEMPRMDGFELATNIRNDDQLKHIPIIMITSRTGQKHRDRAMSIGVNFYLGKPYNEAELLEHIQGLLQPT
ncbi:MAG: Hpt domain-containing protein, partial [Gammaproteobacteria bacterium]|nr:Hpt domain-containing protein [Gammaproteobacteria bacterium]